MNITFLLGNGFDLQLGMKTGYKSFLRWYIEQPTDDADIAKFREYLKDEKGEWWSDAEVAMGQYLGQFTDDNIPVYYKNIRDFKLRLSEYLIGENVKYDIAEVPEVIARFKDFILKSAGDVMLRAENLSLNSKRRINQTTFDFVTFNYTDAIDRLTKAIGKVIDTPNGYESRIGDVYHVHGTLDTNLIMGVDNIEQLDMSGITETTKLRRSLIKPIVNDELGRAEHNAAQKTILRSDYLLFYGLSFGETDKIWWDEIKKRLLRDSLCQVVIFTRSKDENIQTIIPEDILDYVSDKKDEFLAKIGIAPGESYYDDVRKRVFVIRNTERLNITINDIKVTAAV